MTLCSNSTNRMLGLWEVFVRHNLTFHQIFLRFQAVYNVISVFHFVPLQYSLVFDKPFTLLYVSFILVSSYITPSQIFPFLQFFMTVHRFNDSNFRGIYFLGMKGH